MDFAHSDPFFIAVALMAAVFSVAHLTQLTQCPADLRRALEALGVTRAGNETRRVDKAQRYERELNRTRAQMLSKVNKVMIHVSRWSFHVIIYV